MRYTIANGVAETLDSMQYLHAPLRRDLVNFSALAREIKPLVEEKLGYSVGVDAVIMAIRRYADALRKRKSSTDLIAQLGRCSLLVRTGMVNVHYRRTPAVYDALADFNSKLNRNVNEKMYLIERSDEINVIAMNRHLPTLLEIGKKHSGTLQISYENLALVTISFPLEALLEPGLFSFFSNEISEARASIYSVFSTTTMVSFLVRESDAAKVYERVNNAVYESKALSPAGPQTGAPYAED